MPQARYTARPHPVAMVADFLSDFSNETTVSSNQNASAEFSSLNLPPKQLKNLQDLGYQQMTPIQQQSLPLVMSGKDVIAKAKTGSGKTAAFGIGLLEKLDVSSFQCQALVLCPTRELAGQVAKEIRKLARYQHNVKVLTLCGGMPIGPQIGSLAHGTHIVVGTPGRIQDHLRKGTLTLDNTHTVVLDEADRMLDMGFYDAMVGILELTPTNRQTLLFSATYPDKIKQISGDFQRDPVMVEVQSVHTQQHIEQKFYKADKASDKLNLLLEVLGHYQPEHAVIFCNTKQNCMDLEKALWDQDCHAQALHGDLDQRDRDRVLVKFANRSSQFLIATDVAARGLDIDDLSLVINYDLTRDAEVHVHRIGRTGRAGKSGLAISLFTASEEYKLADIADILNTEIEPSAVEELVDGDLTLQTRPPMVTLAIDGGKKNKVRPGDLLGALTSKGGITGKQVGKIDIFDFVAYVAIERKVARQALAHLQQAGIKGRNFKIRRV